MERIPAFPSVEFPSGRNLTPHGAGPLSLHYCCCGTASPGHALLTELTEGETPTRGRVNLKSGKVRTYPRNNIKNKFRNKCSPEQARQAMRQLLPWAEQTRHRDMTAMLMVCCSSVGFFHGFSQSGGREAACVKNEAVNVKSLQYTCFCPDLPREWGILVPLDELPQSQTPQTWGGTAVTQGCWTSWLVSTSPWPQRTCGKGGRAPVPGRVPPWPQHS